MFLIKKPSGIFHYKDSECIILHREDGPAIERTNGDKEWFLNGIRHRENGPAIEHPDGYKVWYFNGKCHRQNGPAIEHSNGYKEWRINGKYHREDGPAVEYANGAKEWYLNGKQLTKEEFEMRNLHIVKNSEGTFYYKDPEHTILHREDGPAAQYTNGDKRWYLNGKLHREDGPAIEFANGEKQWYLNGERHRKDGPAVEVANKTKHWYLNGQLHREDGPAIERSNGDKEWWLDGQKIISFNIQKIKNMKNKDSGENMPTEKAPAFEKFFKDLSDDGMVDDALFNKEVDLLLNDLKKFNLNNSDSLLSDLERALRSDLEKALQPDLKNQLRDDIETVKQPVISNEKKSTNQSGSKSFMNKLTVSGLNGQGTREFIIGDTVKVLATVPIKNSNEENKYFPNVWGNLEFEAERLVFLETIRMLGGQVKSEFIDAKIKGHSIYNDHIQIEWNQNGKIVESFLHKDSIYKNLSEVPEHIHRLIEAEKIFKRTLFTKGQQAWVAIFHLNDADKINQSAFKSQKELLDFVVSKNGYFEIVPATIEEILPLEQVKISFKNGENKDTLIANELNVFFTYEEANKHWGEYVSESLFALTGFSKNQKLKYFSKGKIQEGELEKISASKNMPTFCWFKTENGLVAVPEEDVFHLNEKTPPHIMKRIPFSNKLKMDLGNAGYRIAATQLTNLARKTIVSLLAKQVNDESKLGKFTKMLDTEMGGAVVAGMVGLLLLKYYPANPKAQKLAEELRITSMATIGNEIVDTFIQELLPGLVEAFSSLPETEKKRIVEEVNQETSNIFLEEKNALKEEMIHAI